MSWLSSLFGKKEKNDASSKSYESPIDFFDSNINDIKQLLSSVGFNDRHKRLCDLAYMTGCQVVILCGKLKGVDRFSVIESSDTSFVEAGTNFQWQHIQPAASMNAASIFNTLPFPNIGAIGFISVPVKNSRNTLSGILLGIITNHIENIDTSTRLLHIMAPLFDAEIECEMLRQSKQQYEQRIASLNQNIEVLNTDLKNERQRAIESKGLRSTFLTNLSQEIRTPMNAVIGFVDLLETAETDEERREFESIIKHNSMLLLKAIDNLVEISKLQSSFMFRPSCPRQLNDILNDIKHKFDGKIKQLGKDLKIVTSYSLATPNDTIWNSDEIIIKVMEQLLDNACKHTESGTITMGYTMDQTTANFFVSDMGPGIKEGEEESIFEMFNASVNIDESNGISGLGLAIARKYVELAYGEIWVDKTYKEGARFIFTIPKEKL